MASSTCSRRAWQTWPAFRWASRAARTPSSACGSAPRTSSATGASAPTALGTRAPGWRDSSGVDEAKLNLLADGEVGGGTLRLRAAGTVLNQETAGFIQGYDSYRDEDIARSNPNPEAFRDASSARVSAHFQRDNCFARDCRFELAGIYRRSRMDFIQHFLIGKPFEHNAQTSYMLSGTLAMNFFANALEARAVAWTRRPPTPSSPNSSPGPPPTARPRRMPSAPPAITTTTASTRTPSARPWR